MNLEAVQERLVGLRNVEAQALSQVEQAQAELYALRGAIQDCEYWLEVVSNPQVEELPVMDTPDVEGLPEGVEVKEVVFLDEHR